MYLLSSFSDASVPFAQVRWSTLEYTRQIPVSHPTIAFFPWGLTYSLRGVDSLFTAVRTISGGLGRCVPGGPLMSAGCDCDQLW